MYAIIEQSGKQYKVEQGDPVDIDLIQIDEVVATLSGESAEDSVVKGPKLYPTHFRRRKNSQRRIGHRQKYLRVTIDKIES